MRFFRFSFTARGHADVPAPSPLLSTSMKDQRSVRLSLCQPSLPRSRVLLASNCALAQMHSGCSKSLHFQQILERVGQLLKACCDSDWGCIDVRVRWSGEDFHLHNTCAPRVLPLWPLSTSSSCGPGPVSASLFGPACTIRDSPLSQDPQSQLHRPLSHTR